MGRGYGGEWPGGWRASVRLVLEEFGREWGNASGRQRAGGWRRERRGRGLEDMPGVGAMPPAEFHELASYLSFPQALASAGDSPGKPPSTDGLRTEYSQRGGPFSWDFCFASLPLTRSPTGGAPGEIGKGAEVSETCLIEFS